MEVLVKFEVAAGKYTKRGTDEKVPYERLILYVQNLNVEKPTYDSAPSQESEFEQVISGGGFRGRSRMWVPIRDLQDNKFANDPNHPGYKNGVHVGRYDNAYSIRVGDVEKLLGCSLADFKANFVRDFFLHGISVMTFVNDYGTDEIAEIHVNPSNVIDLMFQASEA